MEEEKLIAKKRKFNMKLYPAYRMLATDVLFYNAIKVLFLTQVKGISNANVVFMETIYAFFKMFMQIPMTAVVSKLGKRNSVILGNIFWLMEYVIIMLSNNYAMLVFSQFISSIAWSCKSIAESPLLSESVPDAKYKSKIFTKIDSKGYSRYCYISAITTVMSGFLYEINSYIPIVLTILFIIITLIISCNFVDMEDKPKEEVKTIKESVLEVKNDFKFIFKSPRLKSLLLMLGFMWGIICLFGIYQTTLLKDIQIPAKYIGIILAVLEIIVGASSKKANEFNEKHKNKSLLYIAIRMSIGIAIAGVVVVIGLPIIPQLAIIILTYVIRMYDKGVFQILKKQYMGNFMTPKMLTKIYSANSVMCSIFRMSIGAIGTALLSITTIEYAMIYSGVIFVIISLIIAKYMKSRVGLRPEQYTTKDVKRIS